MKSTEDNRSNIKRKKCLALELRPTNFPCLNGNSVQDFAIVNKCLQHVPDWQYTNKETYMLTEYLKGDRVPVTKTLQCWNTTTPMKRNKMGSRNKNLQKRASELSYASSTSTNAWFKELVGSATIYWKSWKTSWAKRMAHFFQKKVTTALSNLFQSQELTNFSIELGEEKGKFSGKKRHRINWNALILTKNRLI